jgi:Ca2+-binding EF-hand superfamily protein
MSISASPYLLVLPQLMSAKKKLGRVAAFYDPTKISLSGFESVCLDATQFREQLRRNMNIILTDEELGALVYLFDKNGDGFIDTVEFKNEFFRLGKQDRERFNYQKAQEKEKHEKRVAKNQAKQQAYLERFSKTNVADHWTEAQQRNAIKKIAHIAFTYDSFKGGLEGFADAKSVEPGVFKELIRRKFETYLSPEETGALVEMFDRADNGKVDTREFVYQFFRIGRREREFHFNKQKEATRAQQEAEIQRRKDIHDRFGELVQAKMVPSTEEDRISALAKITRAAIHFKGDSVFSSNLWKSFESSDLNPTEFKELLKSNFDIILSPGELDAMVRLFDTDNSGEVSCVEFMTTFFRIGLRERSRLLAKKKVEEEKLAKAEKIRLEVREQKAKMQCLTSVVWPVLPNDDEEQLIELPKGPITTAELASLVGVGPGEVITYVMHKHAMLLEPAAYVEVSLVKDVITGHGKRYKEGSSSKNTPASPMRSVAPMIPTGKTGRHNAFLKKRPSLQSAIAPNKGLKGKKSSGSFADLYPKASKDTQDFIRQLELREKDIMGDSEDAESGKTKKKTKKKKNRAESSARSGLGADESGAYASTFEEEDTSRFGPESTLNDWKFSDSGQPKASISMYAGEEFQSRPGTSANSQRGGTGGTGGSADRSGSRSANGHNHSNPRMLQSLDGTSSPGAGGSIAEEY